MSEGEIIGEVHQLKEKVYFEHTDFSGVVYHSRYLDFLEHGRSDYVRLLGVSHQDLFDGQYGEKLAFSVYNMNINFHAPARIDNLLIIETSKAKMVGAKIEFQQQIKRNDELLVSADLKLVLVNGEGKPRRLPKELIKQLGI